MCFFFRSPTKRRHCKMSPHPRVCASVQESYLKKKQFQPPKQIYVCDSRSVRLELFLGHHVPRHGVICLKIKGTNLNRPSVVKRDTERGYTVCDNLVLRYTAIRLHMRT